MAGGGGGTSCRMGIRNTSTAAPAYHDSARVQAVLADLESAPVEEGLRATLRVLERHPQGRFYNGVMKSSSCKLLPSRERTGLPGMASSIYDIRSGGNRLGPACVAAPYLRRPCQDDPRRSSSPGQVMPESSPGGDSVSFSASPALWGMAWQSADALRCDPRSDAGAARVSSSSRLRPRSAPVLRPGGR